MKKQAKNYRHKITQMVERIESLWMLEQILQFIQNMIKED